VKRQELSLVVAFPDPETGLIAVNVIIDGHQEVQLVASPAHIASAIEMMAKALARAAKV
jgi:hypothetical protein